MSDGLSADWRPEEKSNNRRGSWTSIITRNWWCWTLVRLQTWSRRFHVSHGVFRSSRAHFSHQFLSLCSLFQSHFTSYFYSNIFQRQIKTFDSTTFHKLPLAWFTTLNVCFWCFIVSLWSQIMNFLICSYLIQKTNCVTVYLHVVCLYLHVTLSWVTLFDDSKPK